MHHVPYTHVLHSGKTVIQHVYDAHYAGAADRGDLRHPRGPSSTASSTRSNTQRPSTSSPTRPATPSSGATPSTSGSCKIPASPTTSSRVGNYPDRIEAESMHAEGYKPVDVTPWETASGGKAVICTDAPSCTLDTTLNRPAGDIHHRRPVL